jgi:tryptophan-rich sensory protein
MKMNKSIIWSLIALMVVAALYRVIPNRPWGFAPQIAMALFAGATIRDKRWAFALPVFSMFISDVLYQVLYANGLSDIPGFYKGQFTNYILFGGITLIGFLMKRITIASVFAFSLLGPTVYFLLSNFLIWINGGGYSRPRNFGGLMQTYIDAVPFYRGSLMATLVFSTILFGGYYLLNKRSYSAKLA